MEHLSAFHYLLGRPDLAALEIDAGFRAIYGEPPEVIPLAPHRAQHRAGVRHGRWLRIEDANGRDVTAETRRELGIAFDLLPGPSWPGREVLSSQGRRPAQASDARR